MFEDTGGSLQWPKKWDISSWDQICSCKYKENRHVLNPTFKIILEGMWGVIQPYSLTVKWKAENKMVKLAITQNWGDN